MKQLLIILLTLFAIPAFGQFTIPFAIGRTTDTGVTPGSLRANGVVRFPLYKTSNTHKAFGIDANGLLTMRDIPDTTALSARIDAATADSATYATNYRVDTAKQAIRAAIPTNTNQLVNGAGFITFADSAALLAYVKSQIALKQPSLGYTAENVANKVGSGATPNSTTYYHTSAVNTLLSAYQLNSDTTTFDVTIAHLNVILALYAPINNPTFTGIISAPNAAFTYTVSTNQLNASGKIVVGASQYITIEDNGQIRFGLSPDGVDRGYIQGSVGGVKWNTNNNDLLLDVGGSGQKVAVNGTFSVTGTTTINGAISASNLSGTNTGDQIISDATITTTDITTNNATTSKHGFLPKLSGNSTDYLAGNGSWVALTAGGTVTTLSIVTGNGFAGSVANPTTTPAVTLSVTATGILKGATGAIAAAVDGTDYVSPTYLTSILAAYTQTAVAITTSTSAGGDLTGIYPNPTIKASVALTTPNIGVATATSVNKIVFPAPATSATVTVTNGKNLQFINSITFQGTDATTMTFPTTSATIARTDAAQTFTGAQVFTSIMTGSISGTAANATVLFTPRNIAGIPFDGSANISIASTNLSDASAANGNWVTFTPTLTVTCYSVTPTTVICKYKLDPFNRYCYIDYEVTGGTNNANAIVFTLPFPMITKGATPGYLIGGCSENSAAMTAQYVEIADGTANMTIYKNIGKGAFTANQTRLHKLYGLCYSY